MDRTFTLYGELAEVVRRETRYLRTYWAEVIDVNDPQAKGRVKVTIPMLGWDTDATGAWCQPRDLHRMVVPAVGDFVAVGFLEGDQDRPYYFGLAHELGEQTPPGFDGPTKVVLYEDADGKLSVVLDAEAETLTITDTHGNTITLEDGVVKIESSGDIELNGNSKRLVTYAELNTAMSAFQASVDAAIAGAIVGHTHAGVMPGSSVTTPGSGAAPATSVDISSSETQTIKTGG